MCSYQWCLTFFHVWTSTTMRSWLTCWQNKSQSSKPDLIYTFASKLNTDIMIPVNFSIAGQLKKMATNPVWFGRYYPLYYQTIPNIFRWNSGVPHSSAGVALHSEQFPDFCLCFFSLWQMGWGKMEEARECFEVETRRRVQKDSLAWCNACQYLCAQCSTGQWFLSF